MISLLESNFVNNKITDFSNIVTKTNDMTNDIIKKNKKTYVDYTIGAFVSALLASLGGDVSIKGYSNDNLHDTLKYIGPALTATGISGVAYYGNKANKEYQKQKKLEDYYLYRGGNI